MTFFCELFFCMIKTKRKKIILTKLKCNQTQKLKLFHQEGSAPCLEIRIVFRYLKQEKKIFKSHYQFKMGEFCIMVQLAQGRAIQFQFVPTTYFFVRFFDTQYLLILICFSSNFYNTKQSYLKRDKPQCGIYIFVQKLYLN